MCLATLPIAFLLGALCTADSVAARDGDVLRGSFQAPITVRGDATVDIGEVSGIGAQLAQKLRPQLMALRYVPAHRDHVPVDSTALLTGNVVLTPTDSGVYAISIEHVELVPPALQVQRIAPPLYPPDMFRDDKEGAVEISLRIGADGRVLDARTISSTHPAFDKAVRQVLPFWRFKPPGVEFEAVVPVVFQVGVAKKLRPAPQFECAVSAERAHVEGQSGCIDLITVVATWGRPTEIRIRRRSPTVAN